MSKPIIASDLVMVLNGILKVARSGAGTYKVNVEKIAQNSSIKKVVEDLPSNVKNVLQKADLETLQRASMVPVGLVQFLSIAPKYVVPKMSESFGCDRGKNFEAAKNTVEEEIADINAEDLEGMYVRSLGVEILQQNLDGKQYAEDLLKGANVDRKPYFEENSQQPSVVRNDLVEETKRIFEQTDKMVVPPARSSFNQYYFVEVGNMKSVPSFEKDPIDPTSITLKDDDKTPLSLPKPPTMSNVIKPLSKKKPASQLGETSKQRTVPATRLSRLVSYGGLAAGLGIGALAEVTKRSLGLGNQNESSSLLDSSPFLTEANASRIVDTLCRVRGAALKIGQILSIQDNSLINPQLQKVFERVRHAADFMPDWQMERVMVTEFGVDWKLKLVEFDSKPFAAASIGQVHLGKLHDGRTVAIKIQYPGVGQGIDSDIDNLMSVLNVWNIIPDGVFIDNIISVAKRELSWEVDYLREAKCAKKFRIILEPYPEYYVPDVIDELTTKKVYCTELIEGIPIDKCETLDQESRNRICFLLLDLFFRELFEFQFMQTDPNWANFLYNTETKQIGLLDFGSSRAYKNSFVDNYMRILQGAAEGNRKSIVEYSKRIGFLSGYESKNMENAHTETVLLLGEALRMGDEPYDFGNQNLTMRIQKLVPVMVKERLCPPPEEIYSLHRKLSGIFLLCSRLKGKVNCKTILDRVQNNYKFDRRDTVSEFNE